MRASSQGEHAWSVAAGVGLGSLLGLMVGLSHSPVLATVLGSIAALVATFLGLGDKGEGAAVRGEKPRAPPETVPPPAEAGDSFALLRWHVRQKNLRVASFAAACGLATLGALWARTHDVLGMPLQRRLEATTAAWKAAGYSPEDTQRFVAFQELGEVPAGALGVPFGKESRQASAGGAPQTASSARGVLFSSPSAAEQDACERLQRYDFANSQIALSLFKKEGGDWRETAERAEALWASRGLKDDLARVEILQLVRDVTCDKTR
jgi:hypothetical protein